MKLKLYNSLHLEIEEFVPLSDKRVSIYTCGPTVYNYAHIGNMRTYVSEDILVRTLEALGYNVLRAMNITDVGHLTDDGDDGDDKMLLGAKREKKTVWEIADYYTEAFFKDFDELELKRPDIVEKATDHIDGYIDFIKVLEEKGFTYQAGGNVYFDISKFPRYNELSRMPLENLQVGSREGVFRDDNKKNPFDFVLWFTKSKFEDRQMRWKTIYGEGYPGWHLECSVIAMDAFGPRMDIHCGGVDHIPTHHTNEIAQSESYTGEKWVNYWWHAEWLIDNEGKMSKSRGEFLSLQYLKSLGYDPMDFKYFLLGSHYRRQLHFSFEALDGAKDAYTKLKARCLALDPPEKTSAYWEEFLGHLAMDLNTANALTVLYDCLKDPDLSSGEKAYAIRRMDTVLKLALFEEKKIDKDLKEEIQDLVDQRSKAKADKDYGKADKLRDKLEAMGVSIKDSKEGTTWQLH
ncbi:MAG TPA: cysteine--tRNA ligase [Clostridia bacterium]|nr:cysteine--tRNA ligase [Clostridia bacterium]